jgi:hypothetical protein
MPLPFFVASVRPLANAARKRALATEARGRSDDIALCASLAIEISNVSLFEKERLEKERLEKESS